MKVVIVVVLVLVLWLPELIKYVKSINKRNKIKKGLEEQELELRDKYGEDKVRELEVGVKRSEFENIVVRTITKEDVEAYFRGEHQGLEVGVKRKEFENSEVRIITKEDVEAYFRNEYRG